MNTLVQKIVNHIKDSFEYITIQELLETCGHHTADNLDSIIHALCEERLLVDEALLPNVSKVESIDDLNDLERANSTIPFITYKTYLINKEKYKL